MEKLPPVVGRVVRSKAGRDNGRYLIIVELLDDSYVNIADGKHRRLAHPKKKKVKHLELMGLVLDGIAGKLENNKKVFDSEIFSALKSLNNEEQGG